MKSFNDFSTGKLSEEGITLTLLGPDGNPCGEHVVVRGTDSESFQLATRRMRRNMLNFLEANGEASKNSEEYIKLSLVEQRRLLGSLIVSWSFSEPCTEENVLRMLAACPYFGTQIDDAASKRQRFVAA